MSDELIAQEILKLAKRYRELVKKEILEDRNPHRHVVDSPEKTGILDEISGLMRQLLGYDNYSDDGWVEVRKAKYGKRY